MITTSVLIDCSITLISADQAEISQALPGTAGALARNLAQESIVQKTVRASPPLRARAPAVPVYALSVARYASVLILESLEVLLQLPLKIRLLATGQIFLAAGRGFARH